MQKSYQIWQKNKTMTKHCPQRPKTAKNDKILQNMIKKNDQKCQKKITNNIK